MSTPDEQRLAYSRYIVQQLNSEGRSEQDKYERWNQSMFVWERNNNHLQFSAPLFNPYSSTRSSPFGTTPSYNMGTGGLFGSSTGPMFGTSTSYAFGTSTATPSPHVPGAATAPPPPSGTTTAPPSPSDKLTAPKVQQEAVFFLLRVKNGKKPDKETLERLVQEYKDDDYVYEELYNMCAPDTIRKLKLKRPTNGEESEDDSVHRPNKKVKVQFKNNSDNHQRQARSSKNKTPTKKQTYGKANDKYIRNDFNTAVTRAAHANKCIQDGDEHIFKEGKKMGYNGLELTQCQIVINVNTRKKLDGRMEQDLDLYIRDGPVRFGALVPGESEWYKTVCAHVFRELNDVYKEHYDRSLEKTEIDVNCTSDPNKHIEFLESSSTGYIGNVKFGSDDDSDS